MEKKRIDMVMVEQGLAKSRTAAAELVRTGKVRVDGTPIEKPSALVADDASIEVLENLPYVSRGGVKLAHALDMFAIEVTGLVVADIGASTGGFTDCLLKRGAEKVYAIDVGHSQLAPELLGDARVVSLERTDVRTATLPELVDLAVIDVSFISIINVLPAAHSFLGDSGRVIALIKPQFEVGRAALGKQGVVKDKSAQQGAVEMVIARAEEIGLVFEAVIESPILGGTGNREYLAHFTKRGTL